jgi:hypothetical protein
MKSPKEQAYLVYQCSELKSDQTKVQLANLSVKERFVVRKQGLMVNFDQAGKAQKVYAGNQMVQRKEVGYDLTQHLEA